VNDKPRGHQWASRTDSEYRGGGTGKNPMGTKQKRKEQKEKDTITPTTVEDMQEVERLYKNYTRKHGLTGT
tara:strand:- start:1885 stop:2097 length:213 start_codon:yes stop_codon:yes gene_type:complete